MHGVFDCGGLGSSKGCVQFWDQKCVWRLVYYRLIIGSLTDLSATNPSDVQILQVGNA